MKVIEISNHKFKKLKRYIPNNINNMECELYLLKDKESWNTKYKLFKKFNTTKGEYFSNKLYTLNSLNNSEEKLQDLNIVLPKELVTMNDSLVGYTMPFIQNNETLRFLLKSDIDTKTKIALLKQLGQLLSNIENTGIIRLSDIHEGNFILNLDNNKLLGVDIDSAKIGNNDQSISKYLTYNTNLWDYPHKYPLDEDDIHIPNTNTTILSYIYIILNMLANYPVSNLPIEKYYDYIQTLNSNGLPNELVDLFSLIYTNKDNEWPTELLDEIPEDISKLRYKRIVKI